MKNIVVKDKIINITGVNDDDYVSLTDIARFKTDGETNPVIANWMRKEDTLEYLKLWEQINNPNFKPIDFEGFKSKPGENSFTISPKKWIELKNAIGIRTKSTKSFTIPIKFISFLMDFFRMIYNNLLKNHKK